MEIGRVTAAAYDVPTATPESDGTAEWKKTTLVVVHVDAGGERGLGYTYADAATAAIVRDVLADAVAGVDPFATERAFAAMCTAVRNHGRAGVCAMAISAVDVALWDLKCKLLGAPLARVLGSARDRILAYASGGFTSYGERELEEQLAGWAARGFRRVKMKVGRDPARDLDRVRLARRAVSRDVELFVDANGAYTRKQALRFAEQFAQSDVRWFEEPVSSDDLSGLRLLRDRAPAGMDISAGEYGYDSYYFRRMLGAGAVDVLQADATRCGGVTGFLRAAALCDAHGLPLSSHCAPALHASLCCAVSRAVHVEWFFDHQRIEQMLFEGAAEPEHGELSPQLDRPGLGMTFKEKDAARYRMPEAQ